MIGRVIKDFETYFLYAEIAGFKIDKQSEEYEQIKEEFEIYKDEIIEIIDIDKTYQCERYKFKCSLDDKVRYIHTMMVKIID